MSGTIFDLVEGDLPEGQKGYMELAQRAPQPKDNSFLNSVKDYAKTALKGGVEGLSRLGRVMGPLQDKQFRAEPEINKEQTEILDEALPTEEGFGQKAIRRGLRMAPSLVASPWSSPVESTIRTGLGAAAGQVAESLNAPEWVQSAAELTGFIGPDITKKLLSSGKNKDLIDFAKKMGMTDEQITPLIQSDFKQKWLAKLTPKRGGTEKALQESKTALHGVYSGVQESAQAQKALPRDATDSLIGAIQEKLQSLPAAVREVISKDFEDLLNSPITGKSLMNFYADINHAAGKEKQVSILKEPIKEAIKKVSPELGSDFEMVNKLYSKYFPISAKLKPSIKSDLVSGAEAIGLGATGIAAIMGHYTPLGIILGKNAAKKISQQMLINPRFQQLSKKMVIALNQNKYSLAQKIVRDFKDEVSKYSKEDSGKIPELSLEEFDKLVNQKK